MKFLLNSIKKSCYGLFFCFLLIASLFIFLLTSTPGLYLSIKIASLYLPGTIKIGQLHGRLLDEFTIEKLNYNSKTLGFSASDLHISWKFIALLHHEILIKQLDIAKLTLNQAPGLKTIKTAGLDELDQIHSVLGINFNKNHWRINSLTIQTSQGIINGKGRGQLQDSYPLTSTLQLLSTDKSTKAVISIQGDQALYHWQGRLNQSGQIQFHGNLSQGQTLYQQMTWQDIHLPFLSSPGGKIEINGPLQDLNVELATQISAPIDTAIQLSTQINARGIHSAGQIKWAKLNKPIELRGSFQSVNEGTLTLKLKQASYPLSDQGPLTEILCRNAEVNARLDPKQLSVQGMMIIDDQKTLQINLSLPQFSLNKSFSNPQRIKGGLNLEINSLDFLNNLTDSIQKISGILNARLDIQGTLQQPLITSSLDLHQGAMTIPNLGLELKPIQIHVEAAKKQWQANGSLGSGGQLIRMNGQGRLFAPLNGMIDLEGKNFSLINNSDYQVHISPKIQLNLAPDMLHLTGSVLIPKALVKPQTFNKTLSLTDDAHFIQEKKVTKNTIPLKSDLTITMGDEVVIDLKGLGGLLTGGLHLQQEPHGSLNASGELQIKNGRYKAYGQDLAIEQGQLIFTGGPIDNPDIEVRANRLFKNANSNFSGSNQLFDFNTSNMQPSDFGTETTVGIEVSGRLKSPKITLYSNPANLSQADILSLLLLGKPANQANQAGGQLLLAAISSMNLDSGSKGLQLLDQLKQTLGFDINLQSKSIYNQQTNQISESQAILVGKSLSKRLYISYSLGLAQADVNILTISYFLNKFLSVQVNASAATSGIDLLYNSQK